MNKSKMKARIMGILINGKYYPDRKPKKEIENTDLQEIHKNHNTYEQFQDYQHHLIQPNLSDGSPNPDFIDYYPEQSRMAGFIPDKDELNKGESNG